MYVLDEYRGKGLGEAMVREMVDHGELAHLRWLLHTRDMHRLYRKVGFAEPGERLMERQAGYGASRPARNASDSG